LLESVVKRPWARISELGIVSELERRQLLIDWNDTERPYPQDQLIQELFEQRVESAPEAVALVCEDRQLTYAELNRRANQLAHYLQRLGVGPESLVGICLERSPELVIALMGVLKAGGAYLPMDANYPAERLAYMIEDARAAVM